MRTKRKIVVIAHNLRSTHNVGSILRTAEGLGVNHVYITGYTPYPETKKDKRLPHLIAKISKDIHKTSLGAEITQSWSYNENVNDVIKNLKQEGITVAALEQTPNSKDITKYRTDDDIGILIGREVEGVEQEVLDLCDIVLEIPMSGSKESFNVSQALAMSLYHLKYF